MGIHTDLPPEQQLILTVLEVGPPEEARIRELLDRGVDWDRVREIAGKWGVFRLFVIRLKSLDVSDHVPSEVMTHMSRMSMGAAARNMILVHEFLKVWRLMREADITAAVFKGPVLGIQAYGDPLIRSFADIDLVVPPTDVEKTIELLTDLGFGGTFRFTDNARRHWARCGRDFGLHKDKLNLDFHQRFIEGPGFLGLTDREWAELPSIPLESEDIGVFSPPHTILALTIHGMRHTWSPPKFLIDLAHYLDNQRDIDWQALRHRAKHMGCRRIVAIGLHLAEAVCGWRMPEQARQALPLDKKSRKSFRHYRQRAVAVDPTITALILFRGILSAFDSFGTRLRYLTYIACTPSPQDFMLINLPKSLHWLYYVIRPLRLTWRFAMKPLLRKNGS